jgi:hypothetical protein
MVVHAYFVVSRRVLDHLRVGRERMKRQQDCQRGDFDTDSFGQGDAVSTAFPARSAEPSVGITILVYIVSFLIAAF